MKRLSFNSIIKELTALAVAAAMLFALAACTPRIDPGDGPETPAPSGDPFGGEYFRSRYSDSGVFCFEQAPQNSIRFSYDVPELNPAFFPDAQRLNAEILASFDNYVTAGEGPERVVHSLGAETTYNDGLPEAMASGGAETLPLNGFKWEYAVYADTILSLRITREYPANLGIRPLAVNKVYNFALPQGTLVPFGKVLEAANITGEDFASLAETAIRERTAQILRENYGEPFDMPAAELEEFEEGSVAMNPIAELIAEQGVFLAADGRLSFYAELSDGSEQGGSYLVTVDPSAQIEAEPVEFTDHVHGFGENTATELGSLASLLEGVEPSASAEYPDAYFEGNGIRLGLALEAAPGGANLFVYIDANRQLRINRLHVGMNKTEFEAAFESLGQGAYTINYSDGGETCVVNIGSTEQYIVGFSAEKNIQTIVYRLTKAVPATVEFTEFVHGIGENTAAEIAGLVQSHLEGISLTTSPQFPDVCYDGSGITIGLNLQPEADQPALLVIVDSNAQLSVYGVCVGMDRAALETALGVLPGDCCSLSYGSGGSTASVRIGEAETIEITFDNNGRIRRFLYEAAPIEAPVETVIEFTDYVPSVGNGTAEKLEELAEALGCIEPADSAEYPDAFYTGGGVTIGLNLNANPSAPCLLLVIDGNTQLTVNGLAVGMSRAAFESAFAAYPAETYSISYGNGGSTAHILLGGTDTYDIVFDGEGNVTSIAYTVSFTGGEETPSVEFGDYIDGVGEDTASALGALALLLDGVYSAESEDYPDAYYAGSGITLGLNLSAEPDRPALYCAVENNRALSVNGLRVGMDRAAFEANFAGLPEGYFSLVYSSDQSSARAYVGDGAVYDVDFDADGNIFRVVYCVYFTA